MNYASLNPEKALIWRILHKDNLPWVLQNGVHCGNSSIRSPKWVSIGNAELIDKRAGHPIPTSPGGTLGDYVPFYFTPFSVMLRNIHTGWNGIKHVPNADIVILVSSLRRVSELKLPFLFTDRHAYSGLANFYDDLARLDKVDWPLLQRRDFKRDPEDPGKLERYQAEALVHRHLPLAALLGVVCYTDVVRADIECTMHARSVALPVHTRPNWYF
ncbi:type II toxin-antitoxin system toxin DNA ADP-ribosyl transferase DarT [Roseateles sp.]|uniref:type II toxin-antitoxin system toxin DNA ADP-ribosyl transferase DarT n=1 Tax=Roseateles sp. TaxID=1971397 RepID=UPI003D0C0190